VLFFSYRKGLGAESLGDIHMDDVLSLEMESGLTVYEELEVISAYLDIELNIKFDSFEQDDEYDLEGLIEQE